MSRCNSKSLSACRHCGDEYCINCSNANDYGTYCSKDCEIEDTIGNKDE